MVMVMVIVMMAIVMVMMVAIMVVVVVVVVMMVVVVRLVRLVATVEQEGLLMRIAQAHRMVARLRVAVKESVLLEIICCAVRRLRHDHRGGVDDQVSGLGDASAVDIGDDARVPAGVGVRRHRAAALLHAEAARLGARRPRSPLGHGAVVGAGTRVA